MTDGFVLFSQPLKEHDLWLDIFSYHYGRMRLAIKAHKLTHVPAQFCQYKISWVATKNHISWFEFTQQHLLKGQALYCGHYLNELITRLVPNAEPYPKLYECYQQCLIALSEGQLAQPWLRLFEVQILQQLGYGFHWHKDTQDLAVDTDCYYEFIPQQGFCLTKNITKSSISGASLLRWYQFSELKNSDWTMAKTVLGSMIDSLLDAPLVSRDLLKQSMHWKQI